MKTACNILCAISLTTAMGCTSPEKESSYEWDQYAIPPAISETQMWVLQSQSDDFNYTSPADVKSEAFLAKWKETYHGSGKWRGPAPTYWQKDHMYVEDGMLQFKASRPEDAPLIKVSGTEKGEPVTREMPATYLGCISSRQRVKYPVYIEARAKIANSVLASDVWLLSPDDTQEIDIIEAYGGDRTANSYGADRIHLSHHVFIRKPFQDYQPNDPATWHKDDKGTIWREDFHRVGVFWRDPLHLEYYVDGKLVRTVNGMDIIDPKGYTNGTGLNKELDVIINMEDQSWRALKGLTPTLEELANEENNTFKVDWIRIYNLVDKQQ